MAEKSDLVEQWKHLYGSHLPALACAKDPVQSHWPVHVDHCFGRIIYDAVIGNGETQWNNKLKSPAIKNMSEQQLRECIDLGEMIAGGKVSLVELDEQSLRARSKASKRKAVKMDGDKPKKTKKVKKEEDEEEEGDEAGEEEEAKNPRKGETISSYFRKDEKTNSRSTRSKLPTPPESDAAESQSSQPKKQKDTDAIDGGQLAKVWPNDVPFGTKTQEELESMVHALSKTAFQKRVLLHLLQIPEGRYTTYGALASFLASSPRAVGNALRRNPLAPSVPCHRVVASDSSMGGFGGEWKEGGLRNQKRRLLTDEGLKFSSDGKIKGPVWNGFREVKV